MEDFKMPKLVGLQAGHQFIQNNIDPLLRGGTGAPGEVDFTIRTRDKLGQILQSKGFAVQLDDANANGNSNTTGKDFDFYLAIHYESNNHGSGGGFLTAPDPSVDSANVESKRIIQCLKDEYFKNTGIVEHEEWISNNMTFYYMWNVLTAKTPCGIIECGVGQDPHDSVILADTDRICNAIARGLCKAFNIPFDSPTPPPPDPCANIKQQLTTIQKEFDDYKVAHSGTVSYQVPIPPNTTNSTIVYPAPTSSPQVKLNFLQQIFKSLFG